MPQPKLSISQPGDRYEREADRVADQVMRMLEPDRQRTLPPTAEDGEQATLSRAPLPAPAAIPAAVPPEVQTTLRASGQPLDPAARAFLEPRFGHDFSQVRIHGDAQAAASAQAVQARAYTVDRHIAFAGGQYAPGTLEGRWLLAHELSHVIQQSGHAATPAVQRTDWGVLGGKCCNESPEGREWALVGDGTWQALDQEECTGFTTDCDGMTCGGGFYYVSNLFGGTCRTPRQDDFFFRDKRWTPTNPREDARSPEQRGSQEGNTPPGYAYDQS